MRLLRLRHGGSTLDHALALWFPGPASFTGEDVAELHLHGGVAVVEAVLAALATLGLRPAEPGEFTRRAFENGKLDLAQAEAVADLVDAQSGAQRRQALGQLGGALSRRHEGWRQSLLSILALLEASVDFPDEELPADLEARVHPRLLNLREELEQALADAARGEQVREGLKIAIVGAPNAGKSSLFNSILGRDAAIVTARAGTTRDVIEAPLVLGGYQVSLADTAGLRVAEDEIEAEGVARARRTAEAADLRIWLVDGSSNDGSWRFAEDFVVSGDLAVLNKADLPLGTDGAAFLNTRKDASVISANSGGGEVVRELLAASVIARMAGHEFPAATRRRHRGHLQDAVFHLHRAEASLQVGSELAAEDVRLAARSLERISGRIDPEEVLGQVFAQFCIGK